MKIKGVSRWLERLSWLVLVLAFTVTSENRLLTAIPSLVCGLGFAGWAAWEARQGRRFELALAAGALFLALGLIVLLAPGLVWLMLILVPLVIFGGLVFLALKGRLND